MLNVAVCSKYHHVVRIGVHGLYQQFNKPLGVRSLLGKRIKMGEIGFSPFGHERSLSVKRPFR